MRVPNFLDMHIFQIIPCLILFLLLHLPMYLIILLNLECAVTKS